jgi:undecaprenyl-diphosphatase
VAVHPLAARARARRRGRRRGRERDGLSASALRLRHALALGALHGPAELVPVSSSGHVALVPELLGWPYRELDGELRKAFEVAVHAGTATGLLVALRGEVGDALRTLDAARGARIALTFAPASTLGLALERPIERRLGTPRSVALAQVAAGLALGLADRRSPGRRTREDATARDHLAIGVVQAAALVPGVSRGGATLTAARLLGFGRPAASVLSRHAALPVIAGATALKGVRLARRGLPPGTAAALAAGAGAAFCSTLAAAPLAGWMDRGAAYGPFAAYRVALGAAVLVRASARCA